MAAPRRERSPGPAGARGRAGVLEREQGSEGVVCTCCTPANPLVLRPDLGTLPDGSAEYGLCVLHDPEPVVYRNRGDGQYVRMDKLSLSPFGDLVDDSGEVVARVAGDTFQRLSTVDDDEPPPPDPGGDPLPDGPGPGRASRPRTFHVDLTEDDFYGSPAHGHDQRTNVTKVHPAVSGAAFQVCRRSGA